MLESKRVADGQSARGFFALVVHPGIGSHRCGAVVVYAQLLVLRRLNLQVLVIRWPHAMCSRAPLVGVPCACAVTRIHDHRLGRLAAALVVVLETRAAEDEAAAGIHRQHGRVLIDAGRPRERSRGGHAAEEGGAHVRRAQRIRCLRRKITVTFIRLAVASGGGGRIPVQGGSGWVFVCF